MVTKDGYIVRDVKGRIRVPESLELSPKAVREIAESMYMDTAKDIGVTQLTTTFAEHDEANGMKGRRGGTKERWTDEHYKFVLENYELDDNTLGEKITKEFGIYRSGMAIKFKAKDNVVAFTTWLRENPEKIKGKTLKEQVDIFWNE